MNDFEICCDESHLEKDSTLYGKFTLGPFLPGQGTTFGNALRRSLLAELSGLAITAFSVIGVMQEFSTLPGLRESVLDLSLNLKQVVLTGVLPYSIPPIGFLKIRGPAIIRASDLKLPAGIYCVSPNQYIGTLSSNGTLHFKFLISAGKGYSAQPHSLYRSLSKIKLKATRSFNSDNTGIYSDYLRFFEQRQTEYITSRERMFQDVKDMEKKVFTNATNRDLEHEVTGNFEKSTDGTNANGEAYANNSVALQSSLAYDTNCTNDIGNVGSVNNTEAQTTKPFLSSLSLQGTLGTGHGLQNKMEEIHKIDTIVKGQGSVFEQKQKAIEKLNEQVENQSRPFVSVTKTAETAKNSMLGGQFSEKTERFNPSTTYLGNANATIHNSNSELEKRFIDVQTQIFQRVNPHQVLPIDAVFTPVSRVNFLTQINDHFETTRENIVLEIWTNGSIHPKRALEEATVLLVQNFDTLLKKIQQGSSFSKGLRYWTSLKSEPGKSSSSQSVPSVPSVQSKIGQMVQKGQIGQGSKSTNSKTLSVHNKRSPLYNSNKKTNVLSAFPSKMGQQLDWLTETKSKTSIENFQPTQTLENSVTKTDDKNPSSLQQSIYNLDIGNFHLSLQTLVSLKEAKIHTLSQLLAFFNSKKTSRKASQTKDTLFLNKKVFDELNTIVKQFY